MLAVRLFHLEERRKKIREEQSVNLACVNAITQKSSPSRLVSSRQSRLTEGILFRHIDIALIRHFVDLQCLRKYALISP